MSWIFLMSCWIKLLHLWFVHLFNMRFYHQRIKNNFNTCSCYFISYRNFQLISTFPSWFWDNVFIRSQCNDMLYFVSFHSKSFRKPAYIDHSASNISTNQTIGQLMNRFPVTRTSALLELPTEVAPLQWFWELTFWIHSITFLKHYCGCIGHSR